VSARLLFGGGGVSPTPPLPPPDVICRAPTRFGGGVMVTTTQLGTIPSWGPEIGMLTSAADRQSVYAAHLAAGAKGLWFSLYVHYQEAGVAYPNGIAAWNDFTGANLPSAQTLCRELLQAGLLPFVQLGGDELGSAYLLENGATILAALAGLAAAVTPTFDSNSDGDWSDPGDNWAAVNVALAAAKPASMALFNWLPTGWARLGTINLSNEQVVAGEAGITWCLEGPSAVPSLFLAPWPPLNLPAGSTWDAEHGVYQPNWTSDPTNWLQYVQVVGRRVSQTWTPPPGAFYDAPGGLGVGGPQAGQPVTVSVDERNPPRYSPLEVCRYEENFTYSWTHAQGIQPAQIDQVRAGEVAMGCDVAS